MPSHGSALPLRTKPVRFWECQAVEYRKRCSHSNTLKAFIIHCLYMSVVPAVGDVLLENLTYVKCSYLPFVTQMDSTVISHNKCYDRLDAENLARFIFHTGLWAFHFHALFSVFTHSQITFRLSHCGLLQRG